MATWKVEDDSDPEKYKHKYEKVSSSIKDHPHRCVKDTCRGSMFVNSSTWHKKRNKWRLSMICNNCNTTYVGYIRRFELQDVQLADAGGFSTAEEHKSNKEAVKYLSENEVMINL